MIIIRDYGVSLIIIYIEIDTQRNSRQRKLKLSWETTTNQESVRMLSRVAFWGVIKALQSDINIWYPSPPFISPHINEDQPGPGRSWCLLSISGLAALDGHYHSLSGTYFSASSRVTCLLPATQAGSQAGPKVYIWNVFDNILRKVHENTVYMPPKQQARELMRALDADLCRHHKTKNR
jgi:hypothetical protein